MIDQAILQYKKFYAFLEKHPKQFFVAAMLILSVSFIGMIIKGVFFPVQEKDSFQLPKLYSQSEQKKEQIDKREKEIENNLKQLSFYKIKSDKGSLTKEDSVKIKYLYNQLQKLKNGH